MNDVRHDELIDHQFGSPGSHDEAPDVIEMGPVPSFVDDEVPGPDAREQGRTRHRPATAGIGDDLEVPPVDAWEQELPADPDAPPPPRPRALADPEVSPADAWEQALPTDRDDDY